MEPIGLVERLGRWSSGRGPLYVLLAARMRTLIDDGELPPGSRLPPDRALAAALAVGRSTVVAAYDQLAVEGRIVRRQGSGTRVAGAASTGPRTTTETPMFLHLLEPQDGVIMQGCAAPDRPPPELAQAYAATLPALADMTGDIGYYPMGHPVLRRAIAERFERRGVPTTPDEVLVTGGGQQALSLLARAFLSPGDRVLVEAPTFPGALEAFREEGGVPRGLPVGLAGFPDAVARHRPALAYVIASYHNPTGAVLPALQRRRLAETARALEIPLIDDEVLADLGFPGESLPAPLVAYDDRVITMGSLSKVIWGGLRIGWVRARPQVIARLARLRAVSDLGGNVPAQLASADLLSRLDSLRHRSAVARKAQYEVLRAELARRLPDWQAPTVSGGQTLWVRLPHGDGTSFAQTALRHGVAVLPGTGLDADGGSPEYVRLHFVAEPDQLRETVRRLASAWRAYQPDRVPSVPSLAI
jgi:DNA-binding transcriptional MocR family regulator